MRTCSAVSVGWSRIHCVIYWESSFLAPFFVLCEIIPLKEGIFQVLAAYTIVVIDPGRTQASTSKGLRNIRIWVWNYSCTPSVYLSGQYKLPMVYYSLMRACPVRIIEQNHWLEEVQIDRR